MPDELRLNFIPLTNIGAYTNGSALDFENNKQNETQSLHKNILIIARRRGDGALYVVYFYK